VLNAWVSREQLSRTFHEGLGSGGCWSIGALFGLLLENGEVPVSPPGQVEVAPVVDSQYSESGLLGGAG
jgi:hypothetical protein